MKLLPAALGLSAALVLLAPTMATASTDSPDVHPDVAYALQVEPGGVVLDYYSAYWPDALMRIDVPNPAARAVGSCATGSMCAFAGQGLGGTKISWATCGSKSVAGLGGQVGSVANARSSGTVQAKQGTTVRASASVNTYANVGVAYMTLISSVSC